MNMIFAKNVTVINIAIHKTFVITHDLFNRLFIAKMYLAKIALIFSMLSCFKSV